MALPSLQKTWRFYNNVAVPTAASLDASNKAVMLQVKNAWIGSGASWTDSAGSAASAPPVWSVVGSSNSVAAGLDAVDRWATVANLVWQNEGSAHSWIVLRNTSLSAKFELLINLGSSSSPTNSGFIHNWFVSPLAGFTGGSTTARPTATDEQSFIAPQNSGNTFTNVAWAGAQVAAYAARVHTMFSTDGMVHRQVIYVAGTPVFSMFIERPRDPFTIGGSANVWNGISVPYWAAGSCSTTPTTNALLRTFWWGTTTVLRPWTRLGSVASPSVSTSAQLRFAQETLGGTVALTQENLNVISELTGDSPLTPLSLWCADAGFRGRAGRVFDLWAPIVLHVDGDAYPNDGTRQFMVMGNFAFPWDRTQLLTS